MIDSHTHLTDNAFAADRDAVIHRARKAGVRRIVIVGQDLAENRAVLAAAEGQPCLLPFLGLHPDRFADDRAMIDQTECTAIYAQIRQEAGHITGIGEVGLDYRVCRSEERREAQRASFSTLVALALELDLPLNVHSRSAGHYALDLLLAAGARRVLMHAFDGRSSHAQRGVEAGFLFSIPPSVVRSVQKQKLVRALPLEALALETDSPVLGPEPGVRNEPANITCAVRAIAEIKGVYEDRVRRVTKENTCRLFGLEHEVDERKGA